MKTLLWITAILALGASDGWAAKSKQNKRKPAELTAEEKALAEAGERLHREMDEKGTEPMPEHLQDKMQWPSEQGKEKKEKKK